ncbi:MAG: hypothetical protein EOO77_09125 [Oxalobacteraceae bacterium]|nr:MAG: hypothetical protein EOO77_09125 [Oxalobacteraceae bacterium]
MGQAGIGINSLYDLLLTTRRAPPYIQAGDDAVTVTIWPQIIRSEVVRIMARTIKAISLTRRERIALSVVAAEESVTADQLASALLLTSLKSVDRCTQNLVRIELITVDGQSYPKTFNYEPGALENLST